MRSFLKKFLTYFVAAGIFSFFLNLFLLTPSLYMLQVYDRVLGSKSVDTLYFITMLLVLALLVMGGMEFVRSRLLVRANNAIDAQLAPYLLEKMSRGAVLPEGNTYAHGLKDLATIKSFLTGSGLAEEVCKLLDNKLLRSFIGDNARKVVCDRYDLKTICLPKQIEWVERLASIS